ncbi:hypothetical protein WQ54_19370 [Bacillus sp. SA1-12]|uniref:restriction endonuclease subunit S n=1 Tax=Bacillus sp. SA1-12 TaxID=1455638 RepID=UPI000627472C|nr:restriction endonuclease subunit S [Bacillus sp. SA1-12]KKI90682.1 hypothetical protein WQ54_19370 [Bacillus sp. SA1-12]
MRFKDWPILTIDDVCIVTDCLHKTAPTVDYETEYKMLRTSNIRNGKIDKQNVKYVTKDTYEAWSIRGKLEFDDVILTREAPMGEVGIIKSKDKFFLGQRMLQLKAVTSVILPDFLYYSLQTPFLQHQIKMNEGTGSVVSNIRIPLLKKMKIHVPPIEIQKRLVKILRSIDEKVEVNSQIISSLEQLTETLYKKWFINFKPPKDKGESSEGGNMVDSEFCEIPAGWKIKHLNEVAEITYGKAFKSKLFNENKEGLPLIRIRNIPNDYSDIYTTEDYEEKYIIDQGDLLIGMDGEFQGHIWKGKRSLLNQRVVKIKSTILPHLYLYFALKKPIKEIEFGKVGTTVIHLSKKDIDGIKILYPDQQLLDRISEMFDPILEELKTIALENFNLKELRDILLPKILSGKIELPIESEEEVNVQI